MAKIRSGFVSNSSSSSFVLVRKDTSLSTEDIYKNNIHKLKDYGWWDMDDEDDRSRVEQLAKEEDCEILGVFTFEYGEESGGEEAIALINKATGYQFEIRELYY